MDDETSITATLGMILERHGYLVETLNRGDRVIPLLEAQPFDLVILDILMPGLNGLELLPMIRDCCPRIPIAIHTASINEAHQQLVFELGAIEFWRKPMNPEDMLEKIQGLLR